MTDVPRSPDGRGIFCNRTLNLRSIGAVGYDMDYTLVHYRVVEWERRAYELTVEKLAPLGWPVQDLRFDPEFVIRGLIIDTERGNIVKANRFGYVKQAYHGTTPLDFESQRALYSRTIVDLAEPRWQFLNTLFSLSEACLYAQLVELLDARRLPETLGYADLYKKVRATIDLAHMEGRLKADIMADPDRFIELDPECPLALLDQRNAGKKLLLVTNSEWGYATSLMSYAFDRFLPSAMTWRQLFDVIIIAARKPDFFMSRAPILEVVDERGLLTPCIAMRDGAVYYGGNASIVETYLGMSGDEILYVGDHIYGDVTVSKSILRWRTALIVRELEGELRALEAAHADQARLSELMRDKEAAELAYAQARLSLQRKQHGYGPDVPDGEPSLARRVADLRAEILRQDERIAPLAKAAGQLGNARWGLLMRAGNDKSHLARQIERRADIYTSRVSNFLHQTPFAYLRSPRGSLPHDPG